jgi:hypothetical protein
METFGIENSYGLGPKIHNPSGTIGPMPVSPRKGILSTIVGIINADSANHNTPKLT